MFTFDGLGLIYNNDPGDVTAETGRYYSGLWFRRQLGLSIEPYPYNTVKHFENALRLLTPEPGVIIRHPQAPYNEPFKNKFSPGRDQQHPLEVAATLWAFESEYSNNWLKEIRDKQSRRFAHKYQNWDFPNPSHWAVNTRRENKSYSWPDFWLLGSSVIQNQKGEDDVADDLNHTLLLSQAFIFNPSANARKAIEVYKKRNPLIRWRHYYRAEVSSLWGMPELWRPWIEKLFA